MLDVKLKPDLETGLFFY